MATIPTVSWDETSPASTQAVSLGDDRIKELKTQLREVIAVDHTMSSSGQGTSWGYHKAIHLVEQADLGTGANGICLAGAQTCSNNGTDKPELCFTDEDDDTIQITKDGVLNVGTGLVAIWGGSIASLPTGWLICDGTAKSRATYADLFAVISTVHGAGDGATTFNLPDMADKFIVGVKSGGTYAVANKGGESSHTHTIAAHSHTLSAHTHTYSGTTSIYSAGEPRRLEGNAATGYTHSHTYSGTTAGPSTANTSEVPTATTTSTSHLPPYYAMCYIIRI